MSFRFLHLLAQIHNDTKSSNGVTSSNNSLATGNQAQQILTEIASIQSLVSNLPSVNYSTELAILKTTLDALTLSVQSLPVVNYSTELNNLQTAVDAIPVIDYSNRFNNVDSKLNEIANNQQSVSSPNIPDYSNQLNSIQSKVNQLPSYSPQSDLSTVSDKVDDVAVLVGGRATSSQANNIYSDTQALRNNDIPRLATGNQATALQTTANATQSRVNSIFNGTYNAQIANAANQAASANAGVQAVRNEQSNRFNAVDSSIAGLGTQISSLTGSNGGAASSVVSLNATALIVPYAASSPDRDLIYALAAGSLGYATVGNLIIGITASSTSQGTLADSFTRNASAFWLSNNIASQFVTLDLGLNKTTRSIVLTGLGWQAYENGGRFPVTLIISGSNNNSSYTTINTWSNIGFTVNNEWKYTVFSNSTAYRYLRFTLSGLNSSGDNYLGMKELRLYGTINNP